MSLKYLYNKFENMSQTEQLNYIAKVTGKECSKFFNNTDGKESSNKNPFGILLIYLDNKRLLAELNHYIVRVMNIDDNIDNFLFKNLFGPYDLEIINTVRDIKEALDNNNINLVKSRIIQLASTYFIYPDQIYSVLSFGEHKYSPWSFLNIDPELLLPAIARHMYKFHYVSREDEETKITHMAHTVCNLIMIHHIIKRRIENAK